MRQVRSWQRALGVDIAVAVNVCPGQLGGPLTRQVQQALSGSGLAPDRLQLELTERSLLDGGGAAERTIAAVRALGVRFVLDDFGTGYSSLTRLRRLPLSAVKLDRSFVAELSEAGVDAAIVGAVVGLSKQLGLGCTVEGIETEQQRRTVSALGTPYGQGFLFGRPTPAPEVPAVLARLGTHAAGVSP